MDNIDKLIKNKDIKALQSYLGPCFCGLDPCTCSLEFDYLKSKVSLFALNNGKIVEYTDA